MHRVGPKSAAKVRPIVARFYYYDQREQVRKLSFHSSEAKRPQNKEIWVQLPKEVRDARKPLYQIKTQINPMMKQAKDAGKEFKFVGKKLYIDGTEYKPPSGA